MHLLIRGYTGGRISILNLIALANSRGHLLFSFMAQRKGEIGTNSMEGRFNINLFE